jgi:hypothetical protein
MATVATIGRIVEVEEGRIMTRRPRILILMIIIIIILVIILVIILIIL